MLDDIKKRWFRQSIYENGKLFIGVFIRIVATLHTAFNWLPFPFGEVCSQVWCGPYLAPHFGFFELRTFPQVHQFTPSQSKKVPSVLRLHLQALV